MSIKNKNKREAMKQGEDSKKVTPEDIKKLKEYFDKLYGRKK